MSFSSSIGVGRAPTSSFSASLLFSLICGRLALGFWVFRRILVLFTFFVGFEPACVQGRAVCDGRWIIRAFGLSVFLVDVGASPS